MVVIHYTAMVSADAACRTLCNPDTEVSAHYLIDEDGSVRSLVTEDMRAWHAGAGQWGDVVDVNSRSIGIELANPGNCPFVMAQMDGLCGLLREIVGRWAIKPARIIGHSDMAPGRKIDPGGRFDWRRLWLEGVGIWPDFCACGSSGPDVPVSPEMFRQMADQFGYRCGNEELLGVFRMRFRPWANGPLDSTDMQMITDLATRFPVDASPITA